MQSETAWLSSLDAVLRRRVLVAPDEPALCEYQADGKDAQHTWFSAADVDLLARRVGRVLQSCGDAGGRVLICLPPGFAFTAAFFGCLYSGRVAVPVPVPGRFLHERRRVAAIATNVDASVVLTGTRSIPTVTEWVAEQSLPLQVLDVESLECPALDDDQVAHNDSDTLALVQYTSGSTSAPKGVMLSHGNLLANVATIARALGLQPDDRVGGWLPAYHDMGLIGQLLTPIVLGGSSVVMDPMTFLRRPHLWLRMIGELGIKVSAAPSFAYELCVRRVTDEQLADLDLSGWEVALNGSEPVSAAVMDSFCARFASAGFRPESFAPAYGLAEATLLVTGSARRRPLVGMSGSAAVDTGRAPVSCGRVDGVDLRIVDPETRFVLAAGEVGEIWVRGASVARGYWNAPELSAATFGNSTTCGEGHFLRTGDLGVVRDGELYVVGRIKDVIVVRGRKLHPHDVEETVRLQHERLRAGIGAAFGVFPPDTGELVVLAHEVAPGTPEQEYAGLVSSIKLTVSREFGVDLDGVVLLRPGGTPRTTSGKVGRVEMRRCFLDGEVRALHVDMTARLRTLRAGQPVLDTAGR
ncbi:fatty acyl-AMP ligase [Saccharopolyspora spinosa]|uniref:Acyl-CoA synthetase (AMP-forming)/AMP-acid ligase II n=1 Tax=Saccharopolyspora spinosa TaxID=60894 RepID=A0A2N3Y1B9_SACSN|nr:fatty acyl-AMP ligase [Saccharopolyspora spinosa]PKW16726.1 acyl-CoA synthetase (AMP-forming)/AMP-acid ligase II [Saccharopolyspora spinosa]